MKNFKIKKIGIIDGMGAFAGARFFQITLEKIAKEKLVIPEIILNAVSIEDFIADQTKIGAARETISERIEFFNQQNVSMVVMACNTAHILHSDLLKISRCPFPSIIDLVVNEVENEGVKRVGILASPTTLKTKLYEDKLNIAGLSPIIPNKKFQILLEKIIREVIDNRLSKSDIDNLNSSTKNFIRKNRLRGVILGCTELPLAFEKLKFRDIKIFDSLDILSNAVVRHLKC